MNFSEFHKEVSVEFGIPQAVSKKILAFLTKRMREQLIFGTSITFRNIGSLVLKVRQPKPFKHFKTGLMAMSKKKYVLTIEVCQNLKTRLKNKIVY
jgi:nucleoid DNA-binding protein